MTAKKKTINRIVRIGPALKSDHFNISDIKTFQICLNHIKRPLELSHMILSVENMILLLHNQINHTVDVIFPEHCNRCNTLK